MDGTHVTIMVIDDDQAFCAVMTDVLSEEGFRVVVGYTCAEALTLVPRERPDLLILDLHIEQPNDGWKLLDSLRGELGLIDLPIIISSADLRSLRNHAWRLRANTYGVLPKPFDIDDLQAEVRRMLHTI